MSYPHTDTYLVVLFDRTLSAKKRYSYNMLAIQREQFALCPDNLQKICGMLNNKNSALQNFSVSEMYDNTSYAPGRCRLLCKASMAVVLSDITKDTSCIIYCLGSEQPPIQWVSEALPWKGSGGIDLNVKLTSHLHVVLRI